MLSPLPRRALALAITCACLFAGLVSSAVAQEEEPPPETFADLTVTKSAAETVEPDADLTYAITIANNGPDAAEDAVLTDPLPAGTTFVSLEQTSGPIFSCTTPAVGAEGTVSCALASLASGAQAEFTLVVHTDEDSPPSTAFTNIATASSSTFDPNDENNSGVATTFVPGVQTDLSIAVGIPETSLPDEELSYAIEVGNGGPGAAADATWTTTLPDTATFVSVTQTSGPDFECETPEVGEGGTVTCDIASLPDGATATFTLVADIPDDTPSGSVFSTTASVTTSDHDPNEENNQSTGTTTINDADVSVALTGPSAATAGDTLTYTLTVANAGPDAATSVGLVDVLPSQLTFESLTQTSGPAFALSSPAVGSSGTVSASRDVLASGQTATFTLVVRVDPETGTSTVTNSAVVGAFEADRVATDNAASVNTSVTELPPPAPTALAATPASPADDNEPRVTGTAKAGSTVRLYTTEDCTGPAVATGTAADFASPGLAVTVADNTTTTFRATATNTGGTSPCSTSVATYTERTAPPKPPGQPNPPARPGPPSGGPSDEISPVKPWRLVRRKAPRTTRSKGRVRVSTGYVVVCPAGGPDCTGRLSLKIVRRSKRGARIKIFLHPKSVRRTFRAGTERKITFRLNRQGRRLLRRAATLRAVLRGSIRSGGGAPVVRTTRVRLAWPGNP